MWRGVLLALAFLTRLPIRLPPDIDDRDQGTAIAFYPLVGLGIGGALALVAAMLAWLGTPPLAGAVILVALLAGVTGALHLDGLADTADAWLGGQGSRGRMLTIMKDPACGPAGVVAVVMVLLGKVAALAALLDTPGGWVGLVLAPLLARTACALLFPTLRYVRAGGLGAAGARHLRSDLLAGMAAAALLVAVLLGGWAGLAMAVAAGAVFALGVHLMQRLLGGFTGDTAGALLEVVETATLLTACIVLASPPS
ncbi:adenosylcobinamide-GDP ribazoletransferase [Aquisalimonas sp.]|uniref:adenosylcobinamide-GDP ribazoletransferase n=1 Tax=Aquisalimonas sp. TaxID=1872621 RepID=UPI0025C2D67C|nr:adenosylcobinamide-GDP ribazoletransferase [Aquisalimonas sp.]